MLFLLPTTESVTFSIAFTASGGAADIDGLSTALLILIMNTVLNLTVNIRYWIGITISRCISCIIFHLCKRTAACFITFTCIRSVDGDFRPAAAAATVACAMDDTAV